MVAAGTLDLATPENQPHRAEVQKVIVDPSARRAGLARMLLRELEILAAGAGRSLLTLDTRVGDAGEALYRAEGLAGRPAVSRAMHLARWRRCLARYLVLFWKRLRQE